MIETAWISDSDKRWGEALTQVQHDIYHLPGYARIDASLVGGDPTAFIARQRENLLFVPLVLQPVPNEHSKPSGWFDAKSPYGFPGPCVDFDSSDTPQQRDEFLREAIDAFVLQMERTQIVTAFLRLHPLTQRGGSVWQEKGHTVHHGETVYCDLAVSEEELWRQTRKRDRSYINRSRREGFRVVRDHQWARLDQFVNIYYQTMSRVSASEFYFLPHSYFHALRDDLGGQASLFLVVDEKDRVASGGIFTECSDTVQYHLGGTANWFMDKQPSKLMIHHVRRWAKARGNRYFHLGGGVGSRKDSLFQFKSGFSKLRRTFSTCRLIANPSVYREMIELWEAEHQLSADSTAGYFPAYRKAMASVVSTQNAVPQSFPQAFRAVRAAA